MPNALPQERISPKLESMRPKFLLGCLFVSASVALAQSSPAADSIRSIFSAEAAEPLAASSTSFQYIIAHWPFGQGFSTQTMFANTGTENAKVSVQFFSQTGGPFAVPLSGSSAESSATLTVNAGDVGVLATQSSQRDNGSLDVAWGIATSNAPLNVFSLFDLGSGDSITGAVGAQAAPGATIFRFPTSVGGPLKFTAGMAIANPSSSNTAHVKVNVINANGSLMGKFQETLEPDNQTIFTLDSKLNFSSFTGTAFTGSVAVCSDQPIGLVTVGFEGGAFFSTSVTNDPYSCQ